MKRSKLTKPPGSDFAGSILGVTGDTIPKVNPNAKPKSGETTGPQNVAGGANLGFPGIPGLLYQNAGGSPTGMGLGGLFPGSIPGVNLDIGGTFWGWSGSSFVQPRKGSYATYRMMALDPTLALIRSLIRKPIVASQWSVQAAEGVKVSATGNKFVVDPISGRPKQAPQKAIDFISDTFLPLRSGLVREALRGLDSGWRPFERVYEIRNGFYVLKKVKPLLPEFSNILHDGNGNFAGLTINTSNPSDQSQGSLPPVKSWIYSQDVEAGNLYGLSRNEPAFDPWVDKQKTRVKKYLLMGKLSGVLPTLYYKPGKTPINGELVDNFEIGKQILAVAFVGGGSLIPTTEYTDTDLQANPELATLAPWKLVIEDAGNYASAMDGFIHEDEHNEKLLVRAWGWGERAAIEATTAGSRADSETHIGAASMDLEDIDDDIAAQVTQGQPQYDVPGLVNELLRLNWGDDAVDAIVVKPAPLVDSKVDTYNDLIKAWFANPALAPYLIQVPNVAKIFQHLDIDCVDDIDDQIDEVIEEIVEAANNKNAPKPPPPAPNQSFVGQAGSDLQGNTPQNQPQGNGNGSQPGQSMNRVAALAGSGANGNGIMKKGNKKGK